MSMCHAIHSIEIKRTITSALQLRIGLIMIMGGTRSWLVRLGDSGVFVDFLHVFVRRPVLRSVRQSANWVLTISANITAVAQLITEPVVNEHERQEKKKQGRKALVPLGETLIGARFRPKNGIFPILYSWLTYFTYFSFIRWRKWARLYDAYAYLIIPCRIRKTRSQPKSSYPRWRPTGNRTYMSQWSATLIR